MNNDEYLKFYEDRVKNIGAHNFWTQCGAKLTQTAKFCSACGIQVMKPTKNEESKEVSVSYNKSSSPIRPGWVWAISIFYIFSFLWTSLSFYLVLSGVITLYDALKQYFENLRAIDLGISVISSILGFSAVVTLFMLRKITIKIWLTVIIFGLVSFVYSIVATNWLAAISGAGRFGILISYVIPIAIYFYTKRLDARGFLK